MSTSTTAIATQVLAFYGGDLDDALYGARRAGLSDAVLAEIKVRHDLAPRPAAVVRTDDAAQQDIDAAIAAYEI